MVETGSSPDEPRLRMVRVGQGIENMADSCRPCLAPIRRSLAGGIIARSAWVREELVDALIPRIGFLSSPDRAVWRRSPHDGSQAGRGDVRIPSEQSDDLALLLEEERRGDNLPVVHLPNGCQAV